MKRQIVVINGGDAFETYEEYLDFLRNVEIDPDKSNKKSWKNSLQEKLGDKFYIMSPEMPNRFNAKYIEWKIWFERLFPFFEDGVILVGHSLGGVFLAKYLSEERFPKKIKATFLVSAPNNLDSERKIVEFVLPESLKLLEEQGGQIFLYHSKDDPVVEFSELGKYQKSLPKAKTRVFDDRKHMNQEEFPEIIEDILSLYI